MPNKPPQSTPDQSAATLRPHPGHPATIRANLRHFFVGLFVDMAEKPLKFLNEIAKGDDFEPRHSRHLPLATSQDKSGQSVTNWLACMRQRSADA